MEQWPYPLIADFDITVIVWRFFDGSDILLVLRYNWLVNKPIRAAGKSAHDVLRWNIVQKLETFGPEAKLQGKMWSFIGESFSQGPYQPKYQ